jgi:hypothetical protein
MKMKKIITFCNVGLLCLSCAVGSYMAESAGADVLNQPDSNSKQAFFEVAGGSDGWWQVWASGYDFYGPRERGLDPVIERSEWIKNILESEYGVDVPFDRRQVVAAIRSRVLHEKGTVPGKWCASITPLLLSSAFSGVAGTVAPELTWPKGDVNAVVRNSSGYLTHIHTLLNRYCASQEEFLDAFRGFQSEYEKVLNGKHEQIVAERAAQELIRKKEADAKYAETQKQRDIERAIEDERKAKEEKEAARKAQEAAEAAKAFALKEAQRLHAEALARQLENDRRMEEMRQYRLAIKSGKRPITKISDAVIFYDAKSDDSIIWQPPVAANNKYYVATGKLSRIEGSDYVFEINTYRGFKYFVGVFSRRTKMTKGFEARFNSVASIVGKHIGTTTATLGSGEVINLPVFDMAVMGN